MASSSAMQMDVSTDYHGLNLKLFFPSPDMRIFAEAEEEEEEEEYCGIDSDLSCIKVRPKRRKKNIVAEEEEEERDSTCSDVSSADITTVDSCSTDDMSTDDDEEEPTYGDEMLKRVRKISEGSHFDVISVLKNKAKGRDYLVKQSGERVKIEASLRGKYVLVCCFFLPLQTDTFEARVCRAMIAAYTDLKAQDKKFEMVMVAKLRSRYDSESVFKHFFSGFPSSCLAIPYDDPASRDYVCKSLDLTDKEYHMTCVIVDPKHKVLHTDAAFFLTFGADAFPFTPKRFEALFNQNMEFKGKVEVDDSESKEGVGEPSRRVSLAELLQCSEVSSIGNKNVTMSVWDLNKKLVGVYLVYDGQFIDELVKIYEQCKGKKDGFEIVLVPLAIYGSPEWLLDHIKHVLKDKYNISSWWAYEFNDKISRRLRRLCDGSPSDQLIIMPPGDKSGELLGRSVISRYGMDAYPFTRESLVDKRLDTLRSLTLESLLGDELESMSDGEEVPLSELRGKKILLFLRWRRLSSRCRDDLCLELLDVFPEIQKVHRRCKLVIVCGPKSRANILKEERFSVMPWLISHCKVDAVTKLLFNVDEDKYGDYGTVVSFGKDGKILSRNAQSFVEDGVDVFADRLREEIASSLENLLDDD